MIRMGTRVIRFRSVVLLATLMLGLQRRLGRRRAPIARTGLPVSWLAPAGFRPADLAGRVTVVEFWTFGCINCRRTIPAMRALAAQAQPDVAIVGIHTPETDGERYPAAVRRAIARERIGFAVAQDNDYRAWNAFDNQYWPALYVLDRQGRVRFSHVGELHLGTPQWKQVLDKIAALRAESRHPG